MQAGLPILACTDSHTDSGKIIVDGGFGWWCESNDASAFAENVARYDATQFRAYGEKAFEYLVNNYSAELVYKIIVKEE
jgi:glycosyltransferase involved in cell wall biosynthesis